MGAPPYLWPHDRRGLRIEQRRLAAESPPLWRPRPHPVVAGCAVCFGATPERGWAAAALFAPHRPVETAHASRPVEVPYEPGLLALREGQVLETAVRALRSRPEVLLVLGAGRDHPRSAGLAVQLGAALDLPTVGITDRPLFATGPEPDDVRGARAPLTTGGRVVGFRVRTRPGVAPVVAHAGWRTDAESAAWLASETSLGARFPEPLRKARSAARQARARAPAASLPGARPPRGR